MKSFHPVGAEIFFDENVEGRMDKQTGRVIPIYHPLVDRGTI